jgi:hypothetical protein
MRNTKRGNHLTDQGIKWKKIIKKKHLKNVRVWTELCTSGQGLVTGIYNGS